MLSHYEVVTVVINTYSCTLLVQTNFKCLSNQTLMVVVYEIDFCDLAFSRKPFTTHMPACLYNYALLLVHNHWNTSSCEMNGYYSISFVQTDDTHCS